MSREKYFIEAAERLAETKRTEDAKQQCLYDFGIAADYGYNYALQHPQWIPVEEMLPEHCDCLLYTEPRNIHGPFEGRFRFGFYNYADQRWEIQGEKWDNTIVTHWMPLPEAPQGKEAKNE